MILKTGDFRDGESRSDFDMTKLAKVELDEFYVGAEETDKDKIVKIEPKEK